MKVKFANKIFEVLYTKKVSGQTIYAVEDEPNHIDWLVNVEVVDAEKKELKKIEQKPAWSEEDERMLGKAISTIRYALSIPLDSEDDSCFAGSSTISWLKSLKERMNGE